MIIMKKIPVLFVLLLGLQFQTSLMAQLQDHKDVVFTAWLNSAFNLIVVDGDIQTATFNTADDYNTGVSETHGIVPGFTTVAMEATTNWNLKIHAADFSPVTGTGSIPINNLGVWCEATGIHQFGTEVKCLNTSIDASLGLTNTDLTLIDLLTDNSGDQTDNLFVLHWRMGTMNGSMNVQSMFKQLSDGLFSQGQYTTTVVLTMTEIP
jgi:hypothetical protein